MGSMASAAADDISIGLGRKRDPGLQPDDYIGPQQETDYQRRTRESVDRMNAPSQEDDRPSQPAPPRAAPAVNYGMAPVAAAPSVPDPDAIGETEQALLDAQKKGRSSTIATSAKGLLSGDDDTSKKRSLMGSLIT